MTVPSFPSFPSFPVPSFPAHALEHAVREDVPRGSYEIATLAIVEKGLA